MRRGEELVGWLRQVRGGAGLPLRGSGVRSGMKHEIDDEINDQEHGPTAGGGGTAVWLNGELLERDAARVGVFDAGFQHGVGLFETLAVQGGRVYKLMAHLERLALSARTLNLTEVLRLEPLAEAVEQTVAAAGFGESGAGRVRLTLTGGDLNLLQRERKGGGKGPLQPTILIVVQPATVYPAGFFEQGVRVLVADGRLNPFDRMAGHKTLNYWGRLQALQAAAARQCGEAIWLSVSNHVMGGSVSNLFVVNSEGVLVTPIARGEEVKGGMPAPVLPGITRQQVIRFAEVSGLEVAARMLTIADVLDASEVFLTNSSWGVLPVVAVEGKAIGKAVSAPGAGGDLGGSGEVGGVGEVTRFLRGEWIRDVGGG